MEVTELLQRVVTIWERQIELAKKRKEEQFGRTARQLWSFKGKSYRDLYLEGEDQARFGDKRSPYYKARINKTAEAIEIFVPFCLSQIPERLVAPDRPPLTPELQTAVPGAAMARQIVDQQDALVAYMLQWFLNYTAREYDLRREARTALSEAFGKGSGVLWHEMRPSGAGLIPASYYDSIDYYLIDPDAKQTRDADYVIRECQDSAWRLAERTQLPRQMFIGHDRSASQAAADEVEGRAESSNDIVTYYRIWSRCGIGHWIDSDQEAFKPLATALDGLGPYVYLEIMPGERFPLNIRPAQLDGPDAAEELKRRLQWPIRFYADAADNPWPCTRIDLTPNAENPWATSPLEKGLAIQIFLDHLYTFIMNHVRIGSAKLIFLSKSLPDAVKDALENVRDLLVQVVDGKPGEELEKLIATFSFPELSKDTWQMIPTAERAYENATGLTPLLYGQQGPTQIRTAKESAIREQHASTRPEDYADTTEDWLSKVAAKEGQAARMHAGVRVVGPLFGEPLPPLDPRTDEPAVDPETGQLLGAFGPMTQAWHDLVMTDDEYAAAAEFSYRVAAGTARRQNRGKLMADFQQMFQVAGQLAGQMATMGNVDLWNGLMDLWGEASGGQSSRMAQKLRLQPGQMVPAMGGPAPGAEENPNANL